MASWKIHSSKKFLIIPISSQAKTDTNCTCKLQSCCSREEIWGTSTTLRRLILLLRNIALKGQDATKHSDRSITQSSSGRICVLPLLPAIRHLSKVIDMTISRRERLKYTSLVTGNISFIMGFSWKVSFCSRQPKSGVILEDWLLSGSILWELIIRRKMFWKFGEKKLMRCPSLGSYGAKGVVFMLNCMNIRMHLNASEPPCTLLLNSETHSSNNSEYTSWKDSSCRLTNSRK